jgi:hypothetical protein
MKRVPKLAAVSASVHPEAGVMLLSCGACTPSVIAVPLREPPHAVTSHAPAACVVQGASHAPAAVASHAPAAVASHAPAAVASHAPAAFVVQGAHEELCFGHVRRKVMTDPRLRTFFWQATGRTLYITRQFHPEETFANDGHVLLCATASLHKVPPPLLSLRA